MQHATRAVGILAMSFPLASCGLFRTPPAISLQSAELIESTAEGEVVRFTLEGFNENGEQLPLRDVRYVVYREGQRVYEGERLAERVLPAAGSQTFVLPAAIARGEGVAPIRPGEEWAIEGRVVYVLPGAFAELLFDTGARRPKASFGGVTTLR